jgi:uncharacterized membrane protein
VATSAESRPERPIHPLHAVLLASALPLFLGGFLSDLAYDSNYQIQWINFAAWLIAGAMVFTGLALLWALIDLIRPARRGGRALLYFLLLLATFILGLIDNFVHARDAYATMPTGLILSAIATVLTLLAVSVGFSTLRRGSAR